MKLELSILMPCLNEEETIGVCINNAKTYLLNSSIQGEIIIADNGSEDKSIEIAIQSGAKVVNIDKKGYGAAILGGVAEAKGTYIIMGDSDCSYDFLHLDPFVHQLRKGKQLVMGNRFKGGVKKGAMPFLHKYLGNPVLSFIGRLFFKIPIGDFHCGLRGFDRNSIIKLGLQTSGMEFASEMIVKSSLAKLSIVEVPTTLSPDGRSRPPHLRTWRDGWRHLRFLLMFSPRWLFLYPGIFLILVGLLLSVALSISSIKFSDIVLDTHSLLFSAMLILLGFQLVAFWFFTKIYTITIGMLPKSKWWDKLFTIFNLERGILISLAIFIVGLLIWIKLYIDWYTSGFGELDVSVTMRKAIPSVVLILLGIQGIMYSFFFSILGIKKN